MPRIAVVFFMFIIVTFSTAVMSSCSGGTATNPNPNANSRIRAVVHDPETGCEYIVTSGNYNAGITPRLTAGGRIICRAHDQE